MIVRVLLLVWIPFLFAQDTKNQESFGKGAAPLWVKMYTTSLQPAVSETSDENVQYLLLDRQSNWVEKTTYTHKIFKPLTKSGIEDVSQIHISFDPAFQKLIVHNARVFRNGMWSDRLETSHYQMVQKEAGSEQNIYDGYLTLLYFLNDIREKDVIEYSYSIIGENPLFCSHFVDNLLFQRNVPVETISYRLIVPSKLFFLEKSFRSRVKPVITPLSESTTEWVWQENSTKAFSKERDEPSWSNPPSMVQLSEYKSWHAVALEFSPLYTLPEEWDASSCSLEMLDLVQKWKAATLDPKERALLALRFVQDQIRYLGMEMGINNWKPHDPKEVFEHRFGDCKDKSFLLHAFLRLLNISSTLVLVHSDLGKNLKDSLPGPFLFNHVILRMNIDNTRYWVDPTYSLQGGSLQTNVFPNYEWGLVLSKDALGLTYCTGTSLKKPIELDSTYVVLSEDKVEWKIKKVFYDRAADNIRRFFQYQGMKKMSEEYLLEVQDMYEKATIHEPLQKTDDREKNKITLSVSYDIPVTKRSKKSVLEMSSLVLKDYLHSSVKTERTSPFGLGYPLWVKEHIHIENPFQKASVAEDSHFYEHESLVYKYSFAEKEKNADYYYELKHLQDHVSIDTFSKYREVVHKIQKDYPDDVTIQVVADKKDMSE
jgi:hypothetical protein